MQSPVQLLEELIDKMPQPKKLSADAKPFYLEEVWNLSKKLEITPGCAHALLEVLRKMTPS